MGGDYTINHCVILYFDNGLEDIVELYHENCRIPYSNEENYIQAKKNYIDKIEKEREDVVYMCNGKWLEKEYVEKWKPLIEKQVREFQSIQEYKTVNLIWVIKTAYYYLFS